MSLSSWLCAMARSLASGVSRCDVLLGAPELRARLGELRLGLRQRRSNGRGVDLEQHVALAGPRAPSR